jgi:hypothetical protein
VVKLAVFNDRAVAIAVSDGVSPGQIQRPPTPERSARPGERNKNAPLGRSPPNAGSETRSSADLHKKSSQRSAFVTTIDGE